MRKLTLSILALTLPLAFAASVVAGGSEKIAGAGGTVFVTERALGSVTAYDAATGEVRWTAKVGNAPIGVTQPHGTDRVYSSDEGSDQLSVLDRGTGALIKTIPMGSLPGRPISMPHHLMASTNGNFIYVGEFARNTVGVVNTATEEVKHYEASPLADARTHAVWITANGKDLYATNTRMDRTKPGDVAHLDARTGERLCNTMVGVDPSEILVAPGGKVGYVSVRGEDAVKELDVRADCPQLTGREAFVGDMPDTLQLTNDGKTLVVTLRATPKAQISLLDTETFVARIVDVKAPGGPDHRTTGHHWLSANGKFTFVAVESAPGLAVVDNETGEVVADYPYPDPPGGSRPHGVFYEPRLLPDD